MIKEQEIKQISIKDLVLWTENPRDPISEQATDQDVVTIAIEDKKARWSLQKLAKEMGERYDFSELPTVVYHHDKPVVYDANRRVILGKIKHGLVKIEDDKKFPIPEFPEEIPCNVCKKEIALKNILRKHGDSGTWLPLERDIFLHKHMGENKSTFLIMEESTGLITANPDLNKRFVKEEILNEENLVKLGFQTASGKLKTRHTATEASAILRDIGQKISDKKITTREKRGQVLEVLELSSKKIIDKNKNKKAHFASMQFKVGAKKARQSSRMPKFKEELFGGKLYLKKGNTNDLYKDIVDLYDFYLNNQEKLSSNFVALVRMSLRLLCEMGASDCNQSMDDFLKNNYEQAKNLLDKNHKTTLASHNVDKSTLVKLLHIGAHNYKASKNIEQTLTISVILGKILTITLGKNP